MFAQDISALRQAEQRDQEQSAMQSVMKTSLSQGALITWGGVVPFRKNDTPKQQPPHRPAPAQPLRPAAQKAAHTDFNKLSKTDTDLVHRLAKEIALRRLAKGLPVSDDLLQKAGLG